MTVEFMDYPTHMNTLLLVPAHNMMKIMILGLASLDLYYL